MSQVDRKLLHDLGLTRIRQIGIVVQSVPRTVAYYSEALGMGPWFRPKFKDEEHFLGGERPARFDLDLAIAFAGNIQYEIIEHRGGDRSIYCDFLDAHGEGIHHLGFYVNDFDTRLAACRRAGIGVLQSGMLASGGKSGGSKTKYAYLDTAGTGGIIFELIETRFMAMGIQMSSFWFELGSLMGDVERIRP